MASDRQERISHLVRINRGKAERPEFLRRLSAALALQVIERDLINLEESDHALHLMREGCAAVKYAKEPGFARFFSKDDERTVFALIKCFMEKLGNRSAAAYFSQSTVCGAVTVDSFTFLARAKPLLGVDGDGLNIISESREDGLMLDFNPDDNECCFELVVWGATWPVLLLACL